MSKTALKDLPSRKQVTQAARMKWNGAQRAGSRLSQQDDYYALLEVPRDATPEHIKKQVCQPHGCCLLEPTCAQV